MSSLRKDMSKLHELLMNKKSEHENLEQGNLLIENDFIHSLKDAELESLSLQDQLSHIKEEKERIIQGILEAEEQIMLWEKKIALARETKETLEKDYGEEEIQGMKAEIHRMLVRYDQLKREQEKLIQVSLFGNNEFSVFVPKNKKILTLTLLSILFSFRTNSCFPTVCNSILKYQRRNIRLPLKIS